MIHKLLLNIQLWMIFIKILKSAIQATNEKYWLYSMIWFLICFILFFRGRKLNISLVFITQSYFAVRKNLRLNSTHYFVMEIPNKRELQQITFNHSSDIDFQNVINLYKKCTPKLSSFLVIDATLTSDNSLRFRENLVERI